MGDRYRSCAGAQQHGLHLIDIRPSQAEPRRHRPSEAAAPAASPVAYRRDPVSGRAVRSVFDIGEVSRVYPDPSTFRVSIG
jgi:hypothetical protein